MPPPRNRTTASAANGKETRLRGAPKGNKNATKGARWRQAIKEALNADGDDKLNEVATKLVEMAIGGDIRAIQEIGDRLDGKPKQAIEADVTGNIGLVDILRASHTKGSK